MKTLTLALVVAMTLVIGYIMGRNHAIRQAELIDITDTEYHLGFGDEIHTYTFE